MPLQGICHCMHCLHTTRLGTKYLRERWDRPDKGVKKTLNVGWVLADSWGWRGATVHGLQRHAWPACRQGWCTALGRCLEHNASDVAI